VSGQADIAAANGLYFSPYSHGEVGAGAELWFFLGEPVAMNARLAYSRSRETEDAKDQARRIYRQQSWSGRLGVDRVVEPGDRAVLYFGPGIAYWRGEGEWIGFTSGSGRTSGRTPWTERWSVSSRFGAIFVLGEGWGLQGEVGSLAGLAISDTRDSRTTWFTNSFNASAGIVFAFGEE
jgi:hypothetical protein